MRSVYLVARRDYLGYVTSIGFWIGMLLTPLLMGLGALAPGFIESASTVQYYAVVERGDKFTNELDRQVELGVFNQAKSMIRTYATSVGQDPEKVIASLEAALEDGSLTDMMKYMGGDGEFELPTPEVIRVEIPAKTSEEVAAFMLSGTLVDGPEGPKEVSSVVFVHEDGQTIEYWKENLGGGIKSELDAAIDTLAQREVFAAAGVSTDILREVKRARATLQPKVPRSVEEGGSGNRTLNDEIPRIVSIVIAFFLWVLIFSVVNYLLMGTIEERSNKIFDTLLTSVKLPQLLAGKLLAVLAVSLTLMGFWIVGGTLFTTYLSSSLSPDIVGTILSGVAEVMKPSVLIPALFSFVLGYLMYGALFLAVGSLCDTVQEAQTLMTPLIILLMVPLFMAMISLENPASPLVTTMSWVPLFTPFLLILRMPTDPPIVNGAGISDVTAWFGKFVPGRKKKA